MQYMIRASGHSRSFPNNESFLTQASEDAEIAILVGPEAGRQLSALSDATAKKAVLIELHTETLGVYTGESRAEEGSNILGFSRFRLGKDQPSNLIELVVQPRSNTSAIDAAKSLFEQAGFEVAICRDFSGRIIDRLVRPYYNEALRRLDERLATADDLDLTLELGLGYPEGPIKLLERSGLAEHYEVTKALFEAYGERAYAPARRALVAHQSRKLGEDEK